MQTDSKKRHIEIDAKMRQELSCWKATLDRIKAQMTPIDAVLEITDENPEAFK